ncbi:MAG: TIR domain-containing protein [Rhodospirillaceae bacterium]|nr:TIR domain-containing protein [Rhodospirillaceae bacterium]
MARKRVFISFDYDNDKALPGNLVAQAERSESPFAFVDLSVKHSIDGRWQREARKRIRNSDLVVVICGQHTHQAVGVEAELSIARDEQKPYFLLRGRRDRACKKPKNARRNDPIHPWKWTTLQKLFESAGRL